LHFVVLHDNYLRVSRKNLWILALPPVGANTVPIVTPFNCGALITINLLCIDFTCVVDPDIKKWSEQFIREITPTRAPH
jgi:hypothetical protein